MSREIETLINEIEKELAFMHGMSQCPNFNEAHAFKKLEEIKKILD